MVKSEHTQYMSIEELNQLQKEIRYMSSERLKEFRNSFDSDSMGFIGEEAISDEDK